jgi:hypothetical protein
MMPALILSYFVALSAVLLVAVSDLGMVGILVALAFVFWVERELWVLGKVIDTGPTRLDRHG